jgi:imidazolonepropionase-like amidohydrolase
MKRAAVFTFAVVLLAAVANAQNVETFVKAGKLLDVRGGRMLTNQVIVIRGDRVARVAPADQVQIPAGAAVTDLSRGTVLPGLIDCHTHIMLTDVDDAHYDDILLKQS